MTYHRLREGQREEVKPLKAYRSRYHRLKMGMARRFWGRIEAMQAGSCVRFMTLRVIRSRSKASLKLFANPCYETDGNNLV